MLLLVYLCLLIDFDPSILKKIGADKTLRNMLFQKKWSNHWYIKQMSDALQRLDKLKRLIEIELDID